MYNKVYEIIRDMPDKRLLIGKYKESIDGTTCHCALGAILDAVGGPMPSCNDKSILAVLNNEQEVAGALSRLGLTWVESDELQCVNDESYGSAEIRYERVLAWLKKQVECSS